MTEALKHDVGKSNYDLLPADALAEVQRVLDFGAEKYVAWNWARGFRWLRLWNAAMRHMWAWVRGEDLDPESGLSHLAHALCMLLFLLSHVLQRIGADDRRLGHLREKMVPVPVDVDVKVELLRPGRDYIFDVEEAYQPAVTIEEEERQEKRARVYFYDGYCAGRMPEGIVCPSIQLFDPTMKQGLQNRYYWLIDRNALSAEERETMLLLRVPIRATHAEYHALPRYYQLLYNEERDEEGRYTLIGLYHEHWGK